MHEEHYEYIALGEGRLWIGCSHGGWIQIIKYCQTEEQANELRKAFGDAYIESNYHYRQKGVWACHPKSVEQVLHGLLPYLHQTECWYWTLKALDETTVPEHRQWAGEFHKMMLSRKRA